MENLREGYTRVTLKSNKRVDEPTKPTPETNPYIPFIEDIVKEVGNLPNKRRKIFANSLAKVGVMVTSLYGATLLTKQPQAEASGLDQLLPYLQQKSATERHYRLQQQSLNQQSPSGEMIPVDGNVITSIKEIGILPVEIVDLLIDIIVTCGMLGVLLAIICLMIAGGFRIMGQLERAAKWSVDIIKGLGQILLAPVVIILLALITNLVLGGIEGLDLFY